MIKSTRRITITSKPCLTISWLEGVLFYHNDKANQPRMLYMK